MLSQKTELRQSTKRVLSVDDVARDARALARDVPLSHLNALAGPTPIIRIDDLYAGYGQMEILHGFDLRVGAGQSLCLIGPNGAGKSTVLHSIFGFTDVYGGSIKIREGDKLRVGTPLPRTVNLRLPAVPNGF